MSQYSELLSRIQTLEARAGSQYQTVTQTPSWGQPAVQDAINKGILQGTGTALDLSTTDVKALVFDYRRANS